MLDKKNKRTQEIKDNYNKQAADIKLDYAKIKKALEAWGEIEPVLVDRNTGEETVKAPARSNKGPSA